MTPLTLAGIRPYLTLFGPAVPHAGGAAPAVVAALAFSGDKPATHGFGTIEQKEPPRARITARAVGPGNALATRTAVVSVGLKTTRGYALLSWEAGSD